MSTRAFKTTDRFEAENYALNLNDAYREWSYLFADVVNVDGAWMVRLSIDGQDSYFADDLSAF